MTVKIDKSKYREQREATWNTMAAIIDKADDEKRSLTKAEAAEYDRLDVNLNALDKVIKPNPDSLALRSTGLIGDENRSEADVAFSRYLKTGEIRTSAGLSTAPDNGQTGSENAGYQIPPGFWDQLTIALKQYGGIEQDFRMVETPTGNPMNWPTIDPTGVTGGIVGTELTAASTISPYVFGQGLLQAWTVALNGPILASLQLVQDSAFDVDEFVADRIGEGVGRTLAQLAISGTGSSQHLGVITALAAKGAVGSGSGGFLGLGTATSVATFGGSKTELVGNLLAPQTYINMIGSVDPAYRDGAKFYVNDAQLEGMRSTVDSYGRPLLAEPSGGSGAPTLWGYPVQVDQNIPNLAASTTGGPVFGNMSRAMVYRRAKDVTVMRLVERYADSLAVGYYGYTRSDFRSNDLRAAVTVKPAAT